MSKITYIYGISHNGVIRYIGKSNYPRRRLYQHINEKSNKHKYNWLQSIIKNNEEPIMEIIDEVPEEEWEFWEQYWILQFKCWGFKLLNATIGGEGAIGYKHTNRSKQKMRTSKLGTKLPDDQKKKISDSIKRISKENPNYNRGAGNSRIYLDKSLLYQKYIVENLSLNKCSVFFNVSKKTIFTNITEYGFKKDKNDWIDQISSRPKTFILQYDSLGNLIREWEGLKNAARETGISRSCITRCCKNETKSAGGYIWRYKNNI